MLTKIITGICLPHMHTVSATIIPNKSQSVHIPRDNIHEIWQELAKNFWPECARYFLKHFFLQNSPKSLSAPKITPGVCVMT